MMIMCVLILFFFHEKSGTPNPRRRGDFEKMFENFVDPF